MKYQFGFELEGFYIDDKGNVNIPPKKYPTDGFPGLVEIRTSGAGELRDQYFNLLKGVLLSPGVNYGSHEHVFSGKEKALLRARHNEKTDVEINNIYGKAPRLLGDKTIASFQINFSLMIGYPQELIINDRIVRRPAQYGLFDFVPIIRNLDEEFKSEIRLANRQPGFYSIKDGCRVKYRSLPNFAASLELVGVEKLLSRISNCVNS